MRADDRVAIVSGAFRGTGSQVLLDLAERGYLVAANDYESWESLRREKQETYRSLFRRRRGRHSAP